MKPNSFVRFSKNTPRSLYIYCAVNRAPACYGSLCSQQRRLCLLTQSETAFSYRTREREREERCCRDEKLIRCPTRDLAKEPPPPRLIVEHTQKAVGKTNNKASADFIARNGNKSPRVAARSG